MAASVDNALAALRLLYAGFYDEPLGLARQIGERANLLQLFVADETSIIEWRQLDDKRRRQRFKAVDVRLRLEKLGDVPVVHADHYRVLSSYGIHPGGPPQYFGEDFPPTPGGHFRLRGMMMSLSELAYVVSAVSGFGPYLLGSNDQIPLDRIAAVGRALISEQQNLQFVLEDWLSQTDTETEDPPLDR